MATGAACKCDQRGIWFPVSLQRSGKGSRKKKKKKKKREEVRRKNKERQGPF